MPELPEVELCRRSLDRWTRGRVVTHVRVPDPAVVRGKLSTRTTDALPGGEGLLQGLVGARTTALHRHGKRLLWRLSGATGVTEWLLHLGMTGRWLHRDTGTDVRHGRLAIDMDDGHSLWFEDTRRFGCVVPVHEGLAALVRGLGPDALDAELDGAALKVALVGSGKGTAAVKSALMDQAKLAGVGNIQATEALWRARISPDRSVRELSDPQWQALTKAVRWTLQRTLDVEQDAEIVYVSSDPTRNPFLVYGRVGEPCAVCGAGIQAVRRAGRVTPFCPTCQELAV